MIRRDVVLPDGTRAWSLIPQTEHARLSAELAATWGGGAVAPIVTAPDHQPNATLHRVRQHVLHLIRHHDDGWATWEFAPGIDPELSRPYSFLEMPLRESLEIWRNSVLALEPISPLEAWTVAGHFTDLLRDSHSSSEPIAATWLAEMANRREAWLLRWLAEADDHTRALAEVALLWLRRFDALSLWFCCGQQDDFRFFANLLADDEPIVFSHGAQAVGDQPQAIVVQPWPFTVNPLVLVAKASIVPVQA